MDRPTHPPQDAAGDPLGGDRTLAEDRRSHADMGRALGDGAFEIAAHAHGQTLKAVPRRDLGQKREMQAGFLVHRRDAHQPLHRQIEPPTFGDEIIGVVGQNTGLSAARRRC